MTEKEEAAYTMGQRALLSRWQKQIDRELGDEGRDALHELNDARLKAQSIFNLLGLSEYWDDEIHLADVLEKIEDQVDDLLRRVAKEGE